MAWCFSTKAVVVTVIIKHACVSCRLWVKIIIIHFLPLSHFAGAGAECYAALCGRHADT